MKVFDRIASEGYEEVVFCNDSASGLRAIVAIHSTALGPALGGTRFYPYADEEDALEDVLRLAKGMTYKSAAAGLDLGGGKAVIIGDPRTDKTEARLRAFARFVQGLSGRYITTADVGTALADCELMRRETDYVVGVSPSLGGSGDPSEATAHGGLAAMRAVAAMLWGTRSLAGKHIAISGLGKVGFRLAELLLEEQAQVSVADIDAATLTRFSDRFPEATVVDPEKIHAVECDIFSPCALGGVLTERSTTELGCKAVVGCANNQLATPEMADALTQRGIVYAPDFVANAGGVINVAEEIRGYDRERAFAAVRRIEQVTAHVFAVAKDAGISTAVAAERIAKQRIADIGRLSGIRVGTGRRQDG